MHRAGLNQSDIVSSPKFSGRIASWEAALLRELVFGFRQTALCQRVGRTFRKKAG